MRGPIPESGGGPVGVEGGEGYGLLLLCFLSLEKVLSTLLAAPLRGAAESLAWMNDDTVRWVTGGRTGGGRAGGRAGVLLVFEQG